MMRPKTEKEAKKVSADMARLVRNYDKDGKPDGWLWEREVDDVGPGNVGVESGVSGEVEQRND